MDTRGNDHCMHRKALLGRFVLEQLSGNSIQSTITNNARSWKTNQRRLLLYVGPRVGRFSRKQLSSSPRPGRGARVGDVAPHHHVRVQQRTQSCTHGVGHA